MSNTNLFLPCSHCGGTLKLAAGTNRQRSYPWGSIQYQAQQSHGKFQSVSLPIPDMFLVPTCSACGQMFLSNEYIELLDELFSQQVVQVNPIRLTGQLPHQHDCSFCKGTKVIQAEWMMSEDGWFCSATPCVCQEKLLHNKYSPYGRHNYDPLTSADLELFRSTSKYVCFTCQDTHMVWSHKLEHHIMCVDCPHPCSVCRFGGYGAYCQTIPCECQCHE